MELSSVTLLYKDLDHLIKQLEELKGNSAIGLYTTIDLEKDWNYVYKKEAEERNEVQNY